MANYPYLIVLQAVVGAGAAATLQYVVPVNEKLTVKDIRHLSTGVFSITDIRDSGNTHFTNASVSTPIPNIAIQKADSPNIGLPSLAENIEIAGGNILYIDVLDTSGAGNTIRVFLNSVKESS